MMKLEGIIRKFFLGCVIEQRSLIELEGYTEYGTGVDKCWVIFTGTLPPFADVKAKEAEFETWVQKRRGDAGHNKPIRAKIEKLVSRETSDRIAEAILDTNGGRQWLVDNRNKIDIERAKLRNIS